MAAENSALIALADLRDLERARAHREEEVRIEAAERIRAEREAAEREAAQEAARRAAADAQRLAERRHQQAVEAAEARRRVEAAEAAARTEHRVRALELERELHAALQRQERQRSGRWLAAGLGLAVVAAAGAFTIWRLAPAPAAAPPAVVPSPAGDEVRALADELARLERENDDIRRTLAEAEQRAEAIASAPDPEPEAEPAPAAAPAEPTPRIRRKPPRGRGDRARDRPEAPATTPTMKPRSNPVVLDDDRSPLAGLEKDDK